MKYLAWILLLAMCFGLTACGRSSEEDRSFAVPLTQKIDSAATVLAGAQTVAVRFRAGYAIVGLSLHTMSLGDDTELQLDCYRYQGSYDATVAQKPEESYTFTNISQSETELYWQFRALDAGDYLAVLTVKGAGILLKQSAVPSFSANGKLELYQDGVTKTDGIWDISVLFDAHTPANAVFFEPLNLPIAEE